MTTPLLKVQVLSKPVIKGKMDVRFPAKVDGGTGIKITKANGIYTFDLDLLEFGTVTSVDPAADLVVVFDASGTYRIISLADLLTSGVDLDLQAIAALTGTGMLARTADNTWALRELIAPAAGLTIANADAVGGNPTFALANDLAALEALSGTDTIYYRSGADTWTPVTIGSLLSWSGGTLNIGDAELVALAGLTSAANKLPYFTGSGTATLADFTSFARTLLDDADAPTMRATLGATTVGDAVFVAASQAAARSALGLIIGADVQAYDADLAAVAALSGTGIARRTGSNTWSVGTAVSNFELATMANGTVKGNASGSTATPSDLTPSQVLDVIGSTRGSILYRGASGWALRSPGTSGQVLTSNGAGADPTYQDAAGGGGASDTDRRNFLLSTAYQSKSFAEYRRLVNLFATGFKGTNDTANGIATASSSNYSVDSSGGKVSPTSSTTSYANTGGSGNRAGVITMSGTTTFGGGSSANLINGTQDDVAFFSTAQTTATLVFDFGSGNAKYIDEVKVYQSAATANGTWVLEGSNDNSSWTTGTGNVAFGSSATVTQAITWGSPATYRYYRLRQVSGSTSTGPYVREIEFKILAAVPSANDMTLVTASQTTDSSVSNARILLEYDNTAAPTINTDLTVEVTCDGGSNWASATLAAVTAYSQGGRKVVETADTACTAGTSFAARIKTLNNKSVPIYAATVQVH